MNKKSYDLPNIQRPEDVELNLKSFNLGRTRQAEIDRVAAFGAIRRAAQWARDLHTKHGWEVLEANAVRHAIRVAIKSPKA